MRSEQTLSQTAARRMNGNFTLVDVSSYGESIGYDE